MQGSRRSKKKRNFSRRKNPCGCYWCTGKSKEEYDKLKEQHLDDEIKECLNKR